MIKTGEYLATSMRGPLWLSLTNSLPDSVEKDLLVSLAGSLEEAIRVPLMNSLWLSLFISLSNTIRGEIYDQTR